MGYSWADLAALSLSRQFPEDAERLSVTEVVELTGPIQAQTARSPFLGLGARRPGTTHAELTAAYEDLALVRGSTIRGTVHTSTPAQHRLLDAVTRVGQRTLWHRLLGLETLTLEEVWDGLETFAADAWHSPADLSVELRRLLAEAGETAAVERLDNQAGRYLAFGHGGLVRRPLKGGWDGQGAPGYRAAASLLGLRLGPTDEALLDAARMHVRCHGPVSRQDLAWWSGLGLRVVDDLLDRLGDEVTRTSGPLDREYVDVPDPAAPRDLPGVRLLPEFDALLCGYDSKARDRFVPPEHHELLWNLNNGLMRSPLLVDGRIGGWWRAPGSGPKRELEVGGFTGTRPIRKRELEAPVASLQAALGIEITSVQL